MLPVTDCHNYRIGNSSELYPHVPSQLCTEGKGAMACGGDSGGPLMYDRDDRVVQVGLLSFGPPNCTLDSSSGTTDYFTRVTSFMPWILDNIEP